MIVYLEYLKDHLHLSTTIVLIVIIVLVCLQVIGELLEFKGKVVPEFMKMRKYFARKQQERETLKQIPETLKNVQELLNSVEHHYSTDNITMRDKWMHNVNAKLEEHDNWRKDFDQKLDKNTDVTLSILIDNKRNAIIDFAEKVIDENNPVTREQFNRIFKMYQEYEDIIRCHNLTNGEVDIAHRIITEAYENRMRSHTFVEDIRGYDM